MNNSYGKILVLMGGWSNEREISLISGKSVFNSLITSGQDVIELDLKRDNISEIKELNPDRVFIVLHGKGGEDGEIQLYLENLGIPYTGSGSESSKICMNKRITKKILLKNNIQTPNFMEISENTKIEDIENLFQYPFVIKPSSEGSSIGVYIAEDRKSCKEAIKQNMKISNDIILEEYKSGKEYTVGILDNLALPVIQLIPPGKFYDYEAKYSSNAKTKHIIPVDLSKKDLIKIEDIANKAHQIVGCRGVSRSDFKYHKGKFYLLEINTQPGMTKLSLVPEIASHKGITFIKLIEWILKDASINR